MSRPRWACFTRCDRGSFHGCQVGRFRPLHEGRRSERTRATEDRWVAQSQKARKGYGFIEQAGGGGDVFVHYKQIQSNGFRTLEANQKFEFEIE
jgi:cold shock CspA family protein